MYKCTIKPAAIRNSFFLGPIRYWLRTRTPQPVLTLNSDVIFANFTGCSLYIYTRNVSKFTTDQYAIFEPWCKVLVQRAPLHLLIDSHPVTDPPIHIFVSVDVRIAC